MNLDAHTGWTDQIEDRIKNLEELTKALYQKIAELENSTSQSKGDELSDRILSFMKSNGFRWNGIALAENLNVEPKAVYHRLNSLARQGKIVHHKQPNKQSIWQWVSPTIEADENVN